MATKKPTLHVPAKRESTAVVNYAELMAKQAAEIASKIGAPGGDRIVPQLDKKIRFPDGRVVENTFDAVIVEFISGNFMYKGKYDPKNIQPPICFALGTDPKDMYPSENSSEMQSKDGCNNCPNNQFGSDGDGKACKNMRLLALLPPDAEDDTPFGVINVSPTATRPFDGFVAKLAATFGKPPAAFIVEIGCDPKMDYPTLRFANPRPIDDERVGIYLRRQTEAVKRLLTEPDLSSYAKKPASRTPAGRGSARR